MAEGEVSAEIQAGRDAGETGAADTGDAGHEGQRAADETHQREDVTSGADGVLKAQLLGLSGLSQADDPQDHGQDGGVAEEPKDHGDDTQHQAGGGVAFSGGIGVFRQGRCPLSQNWRGP